MTKPSRGADAPHEREALMDRLRQAERTVRQAERATSEAAKALAAAISALDGQVSFIDLPNPQDRTLLSVGQAALLAQCSEKTIRRRMRREPDLVQGIGRRKMIVSANLLKGRSGTDAAG